MNNKFFIIALLSLVTVAQQKQCLSCACTYEDDTTEICPAECSPKTRKRILTKKEGDQLCNQKCQKNAVVKKKKLKRAACSTWENK